MGNFDIESLTILWKGMLAIFVAVGVIFIFVLIMNVIDKNKKLKNIDKNKL